MQETVQLEELQKCVSDREVVCFSFPLLYFLQKDFQKRNRANEGGIANHLALPWTIQEEHNGI